MTNGVNAPLGAQSSSYGASAPWTGGFQVFPMTPAYGFNLGEGDFVSFANGLIIRATVAGGAAPAAGVFVGCSYVDPTGVVQFSKYWPANQATFPGTTPTANVIIDPQTVFTIQANGVVAATAVDLNADIIVAGAGNISLANINTGYSGMMVNAATIAANATFPLYILGFDPTPGNGPGINFPNLLVKFNLTTSNAGTAGV